ncbi:hypothetical protein JCM30471_14330 [Desulfuromonas carbonis]|uniref:YhdP family protein n=1 Tax=Desulfuromonas sp. DDH964 TaxID=1823759 RepID=UPI00078C8F63|nr:AsmA-like C-terminal domain-containing protein [Desulfuromonas sp. DDH964]AMV73018.1 hypothetical protein DBW_2706 [Desulfuromonas sp. DDH964]
MRRHPFLTFLFALLLAFGAFLAWLLTSFDLDSYRAELQESLSSALKRPVQMGKIRLSLRHGPAIDVRNVEVGTPESAMRLQIGHLYLRLDLEELLHRRLQTRDLYLDQPVLTLTRQAPVDAGTPAPEPAPFDPQLLERLGFSNCTLRNGSLLLVDPRQPQAARVLAIKALNGHLSDLAPGRSGTLELAGRLVRGEETAPFEISGTLRPGDTFPFWLETHYSLQGSLHNLPAGWLMPASAPAPDWGISGQVGLTARLQGIPKTGLAIDLALTGAELRLDSPNGPGSSALFSTLDLTTRWTPERAAMRFEPLAIELDGQRLQGMATVEPATNGTAINLSLQGTELPLPDLGRILPAGENPLVNSLRTSMTGGQLQQLALTFQQQPDPSGGPPVTHYSIKAKLNGLALKLPRIGEMENLAGDLELTPLALAVRDGSGDLAGNELRFSGRVTWQAAGPPRIEAVATGEFGAAWLGTRLAGMTPADLELTGTFPLRVTLGGQLDQPHFDAHADLRQLKIHFRNLFTKPAGIATELFLSGDYAEQQLALNYGRLHCPPLDVSADGSFAFGQSDRFRLDLRLAPVALADLPERAPLLKPLQLRGLLSGEYSLQGAGGKLQQARGNLNLNGAGLYLGGIIADLNDLSGSLHFNQGQASFAGLTGRIGRSSFTASGSFPDLTAPSGSVHLQARAMHADDLIFYSDQAILRDIDAELAVAPDRLEFTRVTTHLDGGTKAEVRGAVSHFQGPAAVTLDIEADYGNIDEVIALWSRSPEAPALHVPPHHGPLPELLIRAFARRGIIGGMDFEEARGEISFADRTLVIHPLQCRIGPGFVTGQVLVEPVENSPPRLHISGHAEGIAAEVVHQQLLKQSSLVKGSLRGDFYLQGIAGSEFLPTSLGGFSIEIRNGVLREFKSLSKVFSLLNVSQILALKLPDMDREGMPFGRLSGTFKLDRGILSSEDLFVESNAMNLSLVGQLDLARQRLDAVMGVKPLRTVDKIITNIPIAGWVLAGDEKALITAHFSIKGATIDPEVRPIPISSVSGKVLGIFRRVFGLPGKMVDDVGGLLQGGK